MLSSLRTSCGRQRYQMRSILFDGAAMFGPIEVFSREGVDRLRRQIRTCKGEYTAGTFKDFWGDHWSAHEDVFMDRCASRLGLRAIVEPRLLQEAMGFKRQPKRCAQGWAAYHPYKGGDRFLRCQSQAAMRRYTSPALGGPHACSLFGAPGGPGTPPQCPLPSVRQLRHIR